MDRDQNLERLTDMWTAIALVVAFIYIGAILGVAL